ncbi:hypothetical protein CEXT_665411 [Caerostris extrusa]|uniref:Uncharacterized protein n=1 Tax=Caerostris extrusa TaxID=172846 RepID=A0AAV4WBV8_CAEEX|nr:hypothetical protein CEXT_665411 [Caerostris extrusa]
MVVTSEYCEPINHVVKPFNNSNNIYTDFSIFPKINEKMQEPRADNEFLTKRRELTKEHTISTGREIHLVSFHD